MPQYGVTLLLSNLQFIKTDELKFYICVKELFSPNLKKVLLKKVYPVFFVHFQRSYVRVFNKLNNVTLPFLKVPSGSQPFRIHGP